MHILIHTNIYTYTCLHSYMYIHTHMHAHTWIINPRCTCVGRVTVLGLYVRESVCLSVDDYSGTTCYRGGLWAIPVAPVQWEHEKWKGDLQSIFRNDWVQEIWRETSAKANLCSYQPLYNWMDVPTGFMLKSEDFQLTDFSKTISFKS